MSFESERLLYCGIALLVLSFVYPLIVHLLRARFKSKPWAGVGAFLKILAVGTLLIALAKPFTISSTKQYSATALIDISDSMNESAAQKLFERLQSLRTEGLDLEMIPFAKSPSSTTSESGSYAKLKAAWGRLDIGVTNLENALRASANSGKIILLSDGEETQGDVHSILDNIKGSKVRIYPLIPQDGTQLPNELRISNLHAPLIAPAEQSVDIRVTVSNQTAAVQSGTLVVVHDNKEVLNSKLKIVPKRESLIVAKSSPSTRGIKEIVATFTPDDKAFSASIERIYLSAEGREQILLLSGSEQDERYLKESFSNQAYELKTFVAGDKIDENFNNYKAVILNNIARASLPTTAPQMIKEYVCAGGAVIMIGGAKSFGLGGYKDTAIEEVMPVTFVPPTTERKRVNVAVSLVLDKSRSMSFESRIEYARDASRQVVKNLKDDDYIGVIGFDSVPTTFVKMGQLAQIREFALGRIAMIFPGERTNLMPALQESRRSLINVPAGRKHIIILTDGRLPDAGPYYVSMVKDLRLQGVTVSTVLLGNETDISLLKDMADQGGGSFYQTLDPRSLPSIFLQDVKVSTGERTLKEEEEYLVREGSAGPISTRLRSFPPLLGYVESKIKPKAKLELVTFGGGKTDPLLASWDYEKGHAVAFSSDVSGRWSRAWIDWSKFSTFWSDIISYKQEESATERPKFDLRQSVEHGILNLDLTVYNEELQNVTAQLVLPDGSIQPISFEKQTIGRYLGKFEHPTAGKYELQGSLGGKTLTPVAFYLSGELFGERKNQGFNMPLLYELAGKTGGVVNPALSDLNTPTIKEERHELAHWFIFAAICLLLLEIIYRELRWGYAVWPSQIKVS